MKKTSLYPQMGNPMDPSEHPDTVMPTSQDNLWGVQLPPEINGAQFPKAVATLSKKNIPDNG